MNAQRSSPPDIFALLVDRDDDARHLYTEYLRTQACIVDEAADGRDALAKALGRRHDVIITETRVPGIDGYQLCTLLRRDAYTQSTPIIVVTGEPCESVIERASGAGATAILSKPCLPQMLWSTMRRVLDAASPDGGSLEYPDGRAPKSSTIDVSPRRILSRVYRRGDTTAPPRVPPVLACPLCDSPLAYQQSYLGGVSERHPEQWDYYECPAGCGTFQYRQRTRKIRRAG